MASMQCTPLQLYLSSANSGTQQHCFERKETPTNGPVSQQIAEHTPRSEVNRAANVYEKPRCDRKSFPKVRSLTCRHQGKGKKGLSEGKDCQSVLNLCLVKKKCVCVWGGGGVGDYNIESRH